MPISSGVTGLSSGEGGWAHDHALVRACRRARRLAIRCWASELGDSLHGVQALRRRRDGAWPPLRFVPARWSWVGGLVRGTLLPLLLPVHSRALTHPQSLIGASAPNLLVDIFAAASTSKAGQWKPRKKARQFRWQAVVWLIWMKRRRKYVGCSIERGGGYLRLCYRWQNKRLALTKRMPDTPENHARLDKLAGVVAAAIKAGKDPRVLLQEATPSNAKDYPTTITVADYFEKWIADKVPPLVRKAQARDYRRHIKGYVLQDLGQVPIAELSPRDILGLREQLVLQRGLSMKYAKNIIAGSFRAMVRDAREIDGLLNHDPFEAVRWQRIPVPPPDPFELDERSRILRWFRQKRFGFHCGRAVDGPRLRMHPHFYGYVHLLLGTGIRPSEASGLRWGDVDLEARVLRVCHSRHLYEDEAPKTGQAVRTVELLPETVGVLRALRPLRVTPNTYVFLSTTRCPIEPKSFSDHWYACLRALGIRVRGLYATKDTYISTALTDGVNIAWLEAQTGVRYETMRRHYGKWMRAGGGGEVIKLGKLDPGLDPEEPEDSEVVDFTEGEECEEGDLNPDSSQGKPTQFQPPDGQKGPNKAQSVTAREHRRRRRR